MFHLVLIAGCILMNFYGDEDRCKAKTLFEQAIQKGDVFAMNHLAFLYENGIGTEQNIDKAIELYQEAINNGVGKAKVNLANLYRKGERVPKDVNKAVQLYKSAIDDHNDVMAMRILGLMHEKGDGIPENLVEASRLFGMGAELGDQVSKRHRLSLKSRIAPIQVEDIQLPAIPPPSSSSNPKPQKSEFPFMLGDYKVINRLAKGQAGTEVFLVIRQFPPSTDNQQMAMKVIDLDEEKKEGPGEIVALENQPNKENSALKEVAAGVYSHPSIVRVQEWFIEPSKSRSGKRKMCIVMKAFERDLHTEIGNQNQNNHKYEDRTIWKWLHQLCSALAFLHSHRVFHRDIKPENILLTREGDIKIVDFGIFRKLKFNELAYSRIGTERYAAPEINFGYDHSVDLWGIGVTFLEVLVRKYLSRPSEPHFSYREIVTTQKEAFLTEVHSNILKNGYSEDLAQLVRNLLDLDPSKRKTASQIVKMAEEKYPELGFEPSVPTIQPEELTFVKEVDQGTIGIVSLNKWNGQGGGVHVAVKKPKTQASNTEWHHPQFTNEVSILTHLSHSHIVKFYGVCVDHGLICIVEEYVERGNLATVLQIPSVQQDWQLKLKIAVQMTRGLNYLHAQPSAILHRDIKSSNILIDNGWNVKICDFGISRGHLMEHSSHLELCAREAIGRWSAPEIHDPEPKWSTKSDVYSLGMVMWELASHEIPPELKERHSMQIPNDCPELLGDVIRRCWSIHQDDRPSCADILEMFSRHHTCMDL